MKQRILSIQSQVASGFVGNNIATLAIQLHGIDAIAVPTVLLSTHADHDVFYGSALSGSLFADLLKGITVIPAYTRIGCIISGYINTTEIIEISARFIHKWKAKCTGAPYVYDPVFGDTRTNGLYIHPDVVAASITHLLPQCDIITPNQFELEYLLQAQISSEAELVDSINKHPLLRNKQVILTSAQLADTPPSMVETIWVNKEQTKRFFTRKIPIEVVGTGDLFTAILTARLVVGTSIPLAIENAMLFIRHVLEHVQECGMHEMDATALMQAHRNRLKHPSGVDTGSPIGHTTKLD